MYIFTKIPKRMQNDIKHTRPMQCNRDQHVECMHRQTMRHGRQSCVTCKARWFLRLVLLAALP
jgi:hypothetical protein